VPEAPEAPGGRREPGTRSPHAAIVRELRDRFGETPAGRAVEIYLAARGYDPGQIAAVMAELASAPVDAPGSNPASDDVDGPDDAPTSRTPAPSAVRPIRAWAAHERARFTPEAWGRLLELRAAGLGDQEFEHLVDRALLQLDGPVTLPELRALLGEALGPGETDPATVH
jgi:hypothetical protein